MAEAGLESEEKLISVMFTQIGRSGSGVGDERAFVTAELTASEERSIRTREIVKKWEAMVPDIAGLRYVFIREQRGGPPGRDIDIRLQNAEPEILKKAALEVRAALEEYPGISRARDDLFYNKQELLLEVNDRGAALGFTNAMVGNLTRANLEGAIAKRFARGDEEVTLRVLQPRDRVSPKQLEDIELPVPGSARANGQPRYVPLTAIVDIVEKPGFSTVRRAGGKVSVTVIADYADDAGNPNAVLTSMAETKLPAVAAKYNIDFSFGGRSEEEDITMGGLRAGALIGLALIYVVLAFVFASYSRPIIIMSVIPFGVIGMVTGHYMQGFDLTFLSLIGLLGLSGILVNNSIILISRIDERQNAGEDLRSAVINGICDRLRAVTLTSLTTVLGLAPLLFETSVQAQFLLPNGHHHCLGAWFCQSDCFVFSAQRARHSGRYAALFQPLWQSPRADKLSTVSAARSWARIKPIRSKTPTAQAAYRMRAPIWLVSAIRHKCPTGRFPAPIRARHWQWRRPKPIMRSTGPAPSGLRPRQWPRMTI